jgi:hypothetical protein
MVVVGLGVGLGLASALLAAKAKKGKRVAIKMVFFIKFPFQIHGIV